jgi:hypothetical protein
MAHVSPLSIRQFSEHSLSWLSKQWRGMNPSICDVDVDFDFDVQYGYQVDPSLENRSEDAKAFAIANYSGAITLVQFVATKK